MTDKNVKAELNAEALDGVAGGGGAGALKKVVETGKKLAPHAKKGAKALGKLAGKKKDGGAGGNGGGNGGGGNINEQHNENNSKGGQQNNENGNNNMTIN